MLASPALPADLTAAERARLDRGEPVVRMVPRREGPPAEGVAWQVLAAPPERVFRAVADFAHYHEFVPFLDASDATDDGHGAVVSRQRYTLPDGPRTGVVRGRSAVVDAGGVRVWTVEWSELPAPPGEPGFTLLRGAWRLAAHGAGTLVELRMVSDTGRPAWMQDLATRKTLPWVLDGLSQHLGRCRYDEPPPPGCDDG